MHISCSSQSPTVNKDFGFWILFGLEKISNSIIAAVMINMVCICCSFFTTNPICISNEVQAPPYGLTVLVVVVVVVIFFLLLARGRDRCLYVAHCVFLARRVRTRFEQDVKFL